MKKNSLTINYLYNVAYKVLTLITPLITTPYISRVLGVDNVGVYNYTYSVVSYFVLFGVLGLQMYGQREIAYCYEDKEKRSKLFWELVWIRLLTVGVATILYYLIFSHGSYALIYSTFGIELFANAIDISWYYYGMEDFKLMTIRNIIVKLVGVTCIFLFVKNESDLVIYVFCHCIVLLVGNASVWFGMRKRVNKPTGLSKNSYVHLKLAVVFFIPQCLDSIYMLMDKVMLGNLSTMTQVGIYGQADKIVKMMVTVITSLGLVISPRIAHCQAEGDLENLKKYMYDAFKFVFILGVPMMLGLVGISDNFSLWFFGTGYDGVETVMSCLSPVIVFMGLNSVMGWQYMMTVHREKDFIKSVMSGAIANLILNAVLIPFYGGIGAVIASVASMCLMTIINLFFIRNVVSARKFCTLVVKPLIAGFLMLAVILLFQKIGISGVLETCLEVCIGAGIYFILLIIMREEFVLRYVNRIRNKLNI